MRQRLVPAHHAKGVGQTRPEHDQVFASVDPPLPFQSRDRSVSSGNPASGTSFISIPRCVPTSTTSLSLPRDIHSRAIASAE